MPRAAAKPRPPLDDEAPDTHAAGRQQILRTSASALPPMGKPPGPPDVFSLGGPPPAPKKATRRGPPPDLATVVIRKGLPVPPVATGPAAVYSQLWAKLAVGDSVELSDRQAAGLVAHAKKISARYAVRRLSPLTKGVWRTA